MNEVVRFTFISKDFSDPKHLEAKIMQNLQFLDAVSRITNEILGPKISKPTISFEQGDDPCLVVEVDAKDRDIFLRLFKIMIIPAVITFFAETTV